MLLGGSSYRHGITDDAWAGRAGAASPLRVLADAWSWTGADHRPGHRAASSPAGSATADAARTWLLVVLTAAAVLGPLEQARLHTLAALNKHVGLGAWFAAIAAGYAVDRFIAAAPVGRPRAMTSVACVIALAFPAPLGATQSRSSPPAGPTRPPSSTSSARWPPTAAGTCWSKTRPSPSTICLPAASGSDGPAPATSSCPAAAAPAAPPARQRRRPRQRRPPSPHTSPSGYFSFVALNFADTTALDHRIAAEIHNSPLLPHSRRRAVLHRRHSRAPTSSTRHEPSEVIPPATLRSAEQHAPGQPGRAASRCPLPPDDSEKYAYLQRNLPYLTTMLAISATLPHHQPDQVRDPATAALWPFMVFTATYVLYQVISLPVNFTGRGFDLAAHQARIQAWRPPAYPSVDIYLPICGEPIELLRNTWTAVSELIAAYPGRPRPMSWMTGRRTRPGRWPRRFGLQLHPPPRPAGPKKSGNLRYAFARTSGEYMVILDADFAPRPDFLTETLPYMDDPAIGDRPDAAVLPRGPRADLDRERRRRHPGGVLPGDPGGPGQVRRGHLRRDVSGLPAGRAGAAGRRTLIPTPRTCTPGSTSAGRLVHALPADRAGSTGICPDNLDAFVRQQYRWCTGNAGIVVLQAAVEGQMSLPARLTYRLRLLLLRLYRPADLLRPASSLSSCSRSCRTRSGCGTSSS